MGTQSNTHPPRSSHPPLRIALLLLLFLASTLNPPAQTASVSALTVPLILPSAIVFDATGNLYSPATGNHDTRKPNPPAPTTPRPAPTPRHVTPPAAHPPTTPRRHPPSSPPPSPPSPPPPPPSSPPTTSAPPPPPQTPSATCPPPPASSPPSPALALQASTATPP